MTQDFAKIRPEPLLEKKPAQPPPAWSLMLTGVVVGISIGVFGSFLFYLSGNMPPIGNNQQLAAAPQQGTEPVTRSVVEAAEETDPEMQFEFYDELKNYEFPVEAEPVELTPEQAGIVEELDGSYVLQTGAFQQRQLAEQELQRQQGLGLEVFLREQVHLGRTLYLVQTKAFDNGAELARMKAQLDSLNISSVRLALDGSAD